MQDKAPGRRAGLYALCMFAAVTAPARAQDLSPVLRADTVLAGRLHALAATPGQSGIVPITVRVPVTRDPDLPFGVRIAEPPPDAGMVTFTFHDRDDRMIEAVNISTAVIPMDPAEAEDRFALFGALLQRDVLPVVQDGLQDARTEGLRPAEVAGLPAIELVGRATHPVHGPIRWRLVGIPNPDGPDSVYAFVQVATDRMPLRTTADFTRSLSGRLLTSLRYD